MAKRDGKGRQIELAIDELAGALADASAGSARAWLSWMRSGDFGYRKEHWERLGESAGKRLAKAGWPAANTEAMDEFLAWARPRRGSNMSDFNEGEFLRQALSAGAGVTDDIAAGLRWAQRMEGERKAHVKTLPPKTLTDRERSESFARLSLPMMSLAPEAWERAGAEFPWAAPALFDSAARAFASSFSASAEGEDAQRARRGAQAAAAALPQEELNSALRSLFLSYDRGAKKKEARALLGSDLVALGARWDAKVEHPRTGRKQSAIDVLLEEGNAFAAKAALRDMGEEAFWPAFEEAASAWVKWPRQGLELARWVGELGPRAQGSARMALKAASMAIQDDDASLIKQAFEAAGEIARLRGLSAWEFPGFAEPSEPKVWSPRKEADGPLAPRAPMRPRAWLAGSGGKAYALARGDGGALAELMGQLSRRGAAPPWAADDSELSALPDGFRAELERWEIARSLETEGLFERKSSAARV